MRDDAGTLVDIKLEEFWIVLLGMLTFSVDADVFSAFRRRDVLLGASKQLERERGRSPQRLRSLHVTTSESPVARGSSCFC